MKIALVGYGKMGRAIEEIALEQGHEIVLKISSSNLEEMTDNNLRKADVAIEFTNPDAAVGNLKKIISAGLPVVCGSTGWQHQWDEIVSHVEAHQGTLLAASNFSIGMNIFFEINRQLAVLMNHQLNYDISIEEIHHTQKKDSPSGTAITLANDILHQVDRKKEWVLGRADNLEHLSIVSKRIDPAPGTHVITYHSNIDDIQMIHTAHNRKGFASGALLAAVYIIEKKGIYSMSDLLQQ